MRLQAGAFPRALDHRVGTPSRTPSRRVDQCVGPSVGGLRVQLKIRASTFGVSTRGFEPRCRPRKPVMPSASYRAFQVAIV
jgi:hypothetical protein